MGQYSIRELEQLSGIKAHTIRVWERRYKIIKPERTSTNIRMYSDDDLKKIINVSLLNNHGLKISKIAKLSYEEIGSRILDMSEASAETEIYIDQLIVAMVDMSEVNFERVLTKLKKRFDFEKIVVEVVYPFLEKIGVLWQTGKITPAHEHFISNLIRQKLISAIDVLPIPSRNKKKIIMFLPEGELHEIGLLFFNFIARKHGYKTIYLGQSVPHEDLKAVFEIHQPEILITSLICMPSTRQLESYIEKLSRDFSKATILASGLLVRNTAVRIPKNMKLFYKATELAPLLAAV